MVAGREMNAVVAENVMGWKYLAVGDHPNLHSEAWTNDDGASAVFDPPPYSTSIEAAWPVVEKFRAECFSLGWSKKGDRVRCYLLLEGAPKCETEEEVKALDMRRYGRHYAEADTAPLAICLAALKAVGVEVK